MILQARSSGIGWLVLAVVVGGILWLVHRKGWSLSGRRENTGAFLPSPAPPASRTARIVETIVLGAAALVIIAITATWRSTGGLMLMLDKLQPAYAMANVIMFLCAVAGAVVALVAVFLGRTVAGGAILAFVLIAYGWVLNGGDYPGEWFVPKHMVKPVVKYTFNVRDTNVRGAELWVNGVYLGKIPYTTTLDAFEANVPHWPEPPADYETDKAEIPQYSPYGTYTSIRQKWIAFELPTPPQSASRSRPAMPPSHERGKNKTYYARVRYGGEWGLTRGGGGSGGGGSNITYRAYSYFDVIFPERQKRLEVLLDKARLAQYQVTPEWFKGH